MKPTYTSWVTTVLVASLLVLASFYLVLKRIKRSAVPSLTVSPGALVSPGREAGPNSAISPTRPTSADGSPITPKEQAKAAYQQGDYGLAIGKYKAGISEATNQNESAELWNLLGNSYRDNQEVAEAIKSYNQAILLNRQLIASYTNLANIYVSQNNKDKARTVLEDGLRANPANSDLERELSVLNLGGTKAVE